MQRARRIDLERASPCLGATRLSSFGRRALFPLFEDLQNVKDPLEEVMESVRVLAVLRYYEPRLREIFDACAAPIEPQQRRVASGC